MADIGNSTALVASKVIEGEYMLEASEFDAAGKKTLMKVELPSSVVFAQWSLKQQALMLKKGAWASSPLTEIIFAIAYANSKGLDILAGDVYSTGSGRIATSNKAKIKLALATGNIEGIETDLKTLPEAFASGPGGKDVECTVTIHVKGWKKPIVRKAKLSQWYNARNPNWKDRPEHMLELNTTAHAIEYVNPVATEDDEAPPLSQPDVKKALADAKTEASTEPKEKN
jgi:hypothetical protein